MKNRKPYNLKYLIRLYNIGQSSYNLYMIIRAFCEPGYTQNFYLFGCADVKMSQYNVYRAFWHYFVVKMVDMLDTIFFVLRKKQSHVTFLHVFHHCSMVFMCWLLLKYAPGTEVIVAAFINASIHVIMYMYYFFASFGDRFSFVYKYKKTLTIMQIGQFIFILTYYVLAHNLSCGYNVIVMRIVMFEAAANLLLFSNFYIKAYSSGKNKLENMAKVIPCTPLQTHEINARYDENQNLIRRDTRKVD